MLIIFLAAALIAVGISPVSAATIKDPSITITAPSAGETIAADKDYTIKFNLGQSGMNVILYYSTDAGATWTKIAEVGNTATSYTWKTPNLNTTHAMIKIELYRPFINNTYYNTSAEFRIFKPLVIPGLQLVPAAPTNLAADSVSTSAIDLTWKDNAGNETAYIVERASTVGYINKYIKIATLPANTKSYSDTGLPAGTTYQYRVFAQNTWGDSDYSNVVSETTYSFLPVLWPLAPADLTADPVSTSKIELEWADKSSNETGFKIERKEGSNAFAEIGTVAANVTDYTDSGLNASTTYSYRVRAYNAKGNSEYSNTASAKTKSATSLPVQSSIVMRFYINSGDYYVNNQLHTMDTAPIIKDNRTILPIRYVAEALGTDVAWNPADKRVNISMGSKVIKLWINNNTANVNGSNVFIDPKNANVKPIIIPPGRTMLPLRFIAENLGCEVLWNPALQEVTVNYN